MNVLIIGSGGREHALALKISKSNLLDKLYCLPGNPGTASVAENIETPVSDFESIGRVVIDKSVDMVISGPEEPLVRGLRDYFESDGRFASLRFVGPDSRGAQLEGSKDFAKEFMKKYNIPTAAFQTFTKNSIDAAFDFLKGLNPPYVLKADGLAAGKGVLIINDIEEAKRELKEIFEGKFGSAGERVVIEEYLDGIEMSAFAISDGKDYLILPEAKDYKRALDGDCGLNTGGMGAVSPVPFADAQFCKKVEERVIAPTVKGFEKEGIKYNGFIFAGLMNCNGDPYVIEYNVRMGDPESEVVLPRIKSDLLAHLVAICDGKLSEEKLEIDTRTALTVMCVSGGYPGDYEKGIEITGADSRDTESDTTLYHAGTALKVNKLVTAGGRVIAVTSFADNIEMARVKSYKRLSKIDFKGIHYRRDIGLDLI